MATFTNMSELEAVNQILRDAGLQQVTDVTDNNDSETAQSFLDDARVEVLSAGYPFNRDERYALSPDAVSSEIEYPSITLGADTVYPLVIEPYSRNNPYGVWRDDKLWDMHNQTFEWGSDQEFTIYWNIPFARCPNSMRIYVTRVASRLFIEATLGAERVSNSMLDRERRAKASLENEQMANQNVNLLTGSPTTIYSQRAHSTASLIHWR